MILGLDPGKNLGVALTDDAGRLEHATIITLPELAHLEIPESATVVVGRGTGSREVQAALCRRNRSFVLVDEENTSLEARTLYWRDHPPKGLLRLLPEGLRAPPRPIDDYAAYAIVLRYLSRK